MIRRKDVDVEVWWSDDPTDRSAVRLTHKKTGLVAESRQHNSQVSNYNAAIADLERQLAELSPREPRLRRWLKRFAKPS